MPYVHISARDGSFDVKAMSDHSADCFMQQGGDPIYVEEGVLEAWAAHKRQDAVFNSLWRTLQNEQQLRNKR